MSEGEAIDTDEVRRIARLARLTVNDAEAERLRRDLAEILAYVAKLESVDVSGVTATSHPLDLTTRFRDDAVVSGLGVEAGLQNAPERIAEGFGVPKIID
jgi:aspartyl-tRNA(Asn)/glutamyl-tRNA(Gln) amidotransferase subunit C